MPKQGEPVAFYHSPEHPRVVGEVHRVNADGTVEVKFPNAYSTPFTTEYSVTRPLQANQIASPTFSEKCGHWFWNK